MNRGELWWLEHPEAGRHPACILTRPGAIPVMQQVMVAVATTRIRDIPTEVHLGPEDGMPKECVLPMDSIAPVSKALLTERITRLGPAKLAEVCQALNLAMGC
jgi:mRNA interferase MazF